MRFLSEWLSISSIILGFGICGWFCVSPFSPKYRIFAAPLAGIIVLPLGALSLYTLFGATFGTALVTTSCGCCLFTVASAYRVPPARGQVAAGVLVVFAITAVAALLIDGATVLTGSRAILYTDGTDHAGYAHVADWLRNNPISRMPIASADVPYQSWPEYMFRVDPRFGSYAVLAAVSWLRGGPALFSYDAASGIVLSAAALGVAAVYARRPTILGLLTIALFGSEWYGYAHMGYFGKLVGYPAVLFIVGLVMATNIRLPQQMLALGLLVAAAGILYSGAAMALFLAVILGTHAMADVLIHRKLEKLHRDAAITGLIVLALLLSSGVLARPLKTGFPDYGLGWAYILPRLLDLENVGVSISGLSANHLAILAGVSFILWAMQVTLACRHRDPGAIGIIVGPFILLVMLLAGGATATAFQLAGFFYPAALCGTAMLITAPLQFEFALGTALVLAVLVRGPRFAGEIERYAAHSDPRQIFTEREMDLLAQNMFGRSVVVDVSEPTPALVILTTLASRDLTLQWTPSSWKTILGYRGWVPPRPLTPAVMILSRTSSDSNRFELKAIDLAQSRTRQ